LDLATISVYETRLEEFRLQGLRVTITENRRYGNQGVSFLDAEEVAEFAQALANMMRLVAEWSGTDKEYTEVEFMTISGFCIGFYQEGRKTCGYAKTGALGTTSAYFPVQRLDVIKAQADEALRLLLPVQSTPQPKGIKGKTAWGLK
jgi:hypothetical protein